MFKAKKINVDKEKINDFSYRYTMAPIELKDEGFGNGLQTVLLNLDTVASDIMRDPSMIITYLSSVLGCKYIDKKNGKDNTKWILTGKYSTDIIQSHIYDFIERFVICRNCRNPETRLYKGKNGAILSCTACSKTSDIMLNKHTTKIVKLVNENIQ